MMTSHELRFITTNLCMWMSALQYDLFLEGRYCDLKLFAFPEVPHGTQYSAE